MTNGSSAAIALRDGIEGRPNAWAGTSDPVRLDVAASAKSFVLENADVAVRFVGDRIDHLTGVAPASLAPGEGGVAEVDGERVGAFRDDDGALHAVSLVCTHLGCHGTWNPAERSWDCPCHGSRFDVDGGALHGPATQPLLRKTLPETPTAPE